MAQAVKIRLAMMPAMAPVTRGARHEEGKQEEACEAAGDDCGDGVVERERTAMGVGESQCNDCGGDAAESDDDASDAETLAVGAARAREAVEVFNADDREAVHVGGEHGHCRAEQRGDEEAGESGRNVGDEKVREDACRPW